MPSLLQFIRPYIPEWLLFLRRKIYLEGYLFRVNKTKSHAEIFSEIYAKKKWGGTHDFWSGGGSAEGSFAIYETYVLSLLENRTSISNVTDIGCGDFQVSQRILRRLSRPIRYLGIDVVEALVERNQERFGSEYISFKCLDASSASLPAGDLVLVRQVLQHLSNENVAAVLRQIVEKYDIALITEDVPERVSRPNEDIVSGHWIRSVKGSGLFVDLPPFNMKVIDEFSVPSGEGRRLRSTLIDLKAGRL